MFGENASCPVSEFPCTNSSDEVYQEPIGAPPYLAIPAILSSTLSCIGAAILVFSYWKWKDIRTGSRAIITYLSIADFFTAFGYIIGSLNYSLNYYKTTSEVCTVFTWVCQFQSFLTSSSSLSSFFWTSSLAIYLYFTLVHNIRVDLLKKLFPLFHLICWGLPIAICLPLLITGHLGYSYYAVSTWCFVGSQRSTFEHEEITLVMVAGKLWEIATYVVVILLYILIKRHIAIQSKRGFGNNSLNADLLATLRKSDKKLIAIPIVFVLLRCWGTIHFFYSVAAKSSIVDGCTTKGLARGFVFFGIMHAIGDGGQGWGNFILYVMVSDKVRNKLFSCCFKQHQTPGLNHLEDKSSITNSNDPSINYGTVKKGGFNPFKFTKNREETEKVESFEPTTA